MKMDLLTNATVVDDAIRFVSSNNSKDEQEKQQTTKMTTTTNAVF